MPKQKTKKDLAALIKKNISQTDALLKKVDKIDKDLKRFQLMNFIRFLIVAVPVALAFLYLVPIFRDFLEIYKPLLELLEQFNQFRF